MRTPWLLSLALLLVAQPCASQTTGFNSELALFTDDERLESAFRWAKGQATAFAFDGDAVGPWFEAALPGREAFCMRDVAHQAMGAHALGMQVHVRNMLHRFAEQIRPSRDWASLWEIDRHNRPAHADYRNDRDFWYNLPANFDVLDAAYRMYLWSGDPAYVRDSVFLAFYRHSVTDYVDRWALGTGSIMTRKRIMNRAGTVDPDAKFVNARGIPGYNEESDEFVVGLDLLAAQYAGLCGLCAHHGSPRRCPGGAQLAAKGERCAGHSSTHAGGMSSRSHSTITSPPDTLSRIAALTRGTPPRSTGRWRPRAHMSRATVDGLVRQIRRTPSAPIEEQSHHPEILYRYGASDVAYDQILDLTRADRERREYPEVSFSVVGAIVSGLMGVSVDPVVPGRESVLLPYSANPHVMTLPQLPAKTVFADLRHLPVRANNISLRHEGNSATDFTNNRGPALVWQAAFPGEFTELLVNGKRVKATRLTLPAGRVVSITRVVVAPGAKVRVAVPN